MVGNSKRNGFTLIELLVVIAIIGVLSAAVALTFSVVTKVSSQAMEQNSALSQVHMAGSWISKDMKNVVKDEVPGLVKATDELSATDNTLLCFMQCYAWDSLNNGFAAVNVNVTYRIVNGILTRKSQPANGSAPETIITIAQYIEGPGLGTTYFVQADDDPDHYYTLTVTADYNNAHITKIYKIMRGYNSEE